MPEVPPIDRYASDMLERLVLARGAEEECKRLHMRGAYRWYKQEKERLIAKLQDIPEEDRMGDGW